jgi:hypothetical protein
MKLDYGRSINRALMFGFSPKRWLPIFLLNLTFVLIVISFILVSIPFFTAFTESQMTGTQMDSSVAIAMIGLVIPLVLVAFFWYLLAVWIIGAIIHQTYKENEYMKSWKISLNRYLYLLAAMILVTVITGVVSVIPYIGWVISIIFGLMFFFAMQGVMISKLGPVESLKNSYSIFRKSALDVFLIWLIALIITLVIVGIFAIPAIMLFIGLLIPALSLSMTQAGISTMLMNLIQSGFMIVAAVGTLIVVGMSVAQAFSLKLQTEFYLQFKKKPQS